MVGSGRMAYFLAKRFLSKNFHVAVVSPDETEATSLARNLNARVLVGDGTTPRLLQDADADRADIVMALLPADEDNLVACQVAQRMFHVPRVVALVNDPDNVELFEQLGVATTFSATELLAQVIEERTDTAGVLTLLPLAGGRAHVTEVVLPSDAPVVGRRIRDLRIPPGALIALVLREESALVPSGETELRSDDRLVLISQPEDHGPFLRLLLGQSA